MTFFRYLLVKIQAGVGMKFDNRKRKIQSEHFEKSQEMLLEFDNDRNYD